MILILIEPLWRAVKIATIDLISTANGKALGAAAFERTDQPFHETFVRTLHDEALEPFWATTISSVLAEISAKVTPFVPEQVAIIPGKLLGEAWHWLITSHQSTNKEKLTKNKDGNGGNIFSLFFETFVKKPSDLILKLCGLGEKEGIFSWFITSQLGIFTLASFSLKNDEEENLPGVNLDPNDSALKNIGRGLGYTLVEQATYAISQGVRFYIDFNEEFGGGENWLKKDKDGSKKKEVIAKTIANVVNERLFPGHILLGVFSALSTYFLGNIVPKTTAAAIGEFPMSILNRTVNCRNRRATKDVVERTYDKTGKIISQTYKLDNKGNKTPNYRFNKSKIFNRFLDYCDDALSAPKELCLDLITYLFRGNQDSKIFKKNLKESFEMNLNITA